MIAVLPGDGVGVEVTEAALELISMFPVNWELTICDGGWSSWLAEGEPIPARTWDMIAASDCLLLGATTSKPKREANKALPPHLQGSCTYVSPIVQLRQRLELFANVRPLRDLRHHAFDMTVIRENTEGLYSGLDFADVSSTPLADVVAAHPNVAHGQGRVSATVRLQTEYASRRLCEFAFEYAVQHGYSTVTLADKPNVLRESSHELRIYFEDVARHYQGVNTEILNVDALALWMVRSPNRFGVIVAENMFGDIMSDLGAALIGGLGVAPSGNYGKHGAYFEPVHGSAPRIAGQGVANPLAMFLSVAQMAEYLGAADVAATIRIAVTRVMEAGKVTYDLGGDLSTSQVTKETITQLQRQAS